MQATRDGDSNLLDQSIIVYGSALSDGNAHVHNNVPIVVVGGMGRIKAGRHVRFQGLPMSNLLLSVLDVAKISIDGYLDSKYSDSTGKLDLTTV
jgi:hypothetical protein